jgi:guanylate kinase
LNNKDNGMLFVISAPSGAGKSSLIQSILDIDNNFELSISATTRMPRDGEEEGKHYFFMNDRQFNALISQNEFIEYAEVHNHKYGTLKSHIEEKLQKGTNVICDIDVQGYKLIKDASIKHTSIFIIPPSLDELESRLIKRGLDSEKIINTRLNNAKEELIFAEEFDFRILNDNYESASKEIIDIVVNGISSVNKDKINLKILRDMLS